VRFLPYGIAVSVLDSSPDIGQTPTPDDTAG
jgi:hypothetical protein